MSLNNYTLGGVGKHTRIAMLKQASGQPLTRGEMQRLAGRMAVEAKYKANGWNINGGGLDTIHSELAAGDQAKARARELGGIQARYGDNAISGVQKYNREDLIDRDRLNKANVEGQLWRNKQEQFKAENQREVYGRGVEKHNSEMALDKARLKKITQETEHAEVNFYKKAKDEQEAEDLKLARGDVLISEQKYIDKWSAAPGFTFDRVKYYEGLRADALRKGNRLKVNAIDGILSEEQKRRLDAQSAADKSAVATAKIRNYEASANAKMEQIKMAHIKLQQEMGKSKIDLNNPEHVKKALEFVNVKIAEAQKSGNTQAVADWSAYKNRVLLKNTGVDEYSYKLDGSGNTAANGGDDVGSTLPLSTKGKSNNVVPLNSGNKRWTINKTTSVGEKNK